MSVVVVTDSSCCLDREAVERYDIRVVPLHVISEGRELREGVDELPEDLSKVTTSGPAPAELTDVYARALADSDGDGVVAVHISRQLSGTWEAAKYAADAFGGRVRLVDSRNTAMGLGFSALAAARLAETGASLDEVFARAVDVAEAGRALLVVDRLDHLRRGGRIGTATALLGTALSMKPVLHLVDGKLVLREKTRTMSKALAKLVEAVVDQCAEVAKIAEPKVAVHHRDAPERAKSLLDELTGRLPEGTELRMTELDAVLGAHVGPGAIGIVVSRDGQDPDRNVHAEP
ncbi:DegV family protein [Rhodococcus sp. NPDC003382]|uniref:DegV family protein n=1 Tax=unclassified Rhodococcus (in: high G+C Gram-positive bacteria) TaxID=192944 RepID=UPI0018CD7A82|nr:MULTISPECIES: DegV family protein [unclassified Rhodococcus (in: high G+C Gram-positive bacteria)]MBH0120273.1 DegV family protein [Rhodococcus sp. CX]MCK8670201.1 DegV family protein [Rhodococcus sp. HM1]